MLNSIRIFLKVVETGSFSKAASVLKVAPSSIARNIDKLEKELNTALFERSTRQMLLTESGQIFLKGANKLIQDAEHLRFTLSSDKREPEGVLRLSVFESFGRLYICPIIPKLLAKYPKVKIELELENKMIDLQSENVDVAIRIGEPADSQLKARKLLPNKTVLCATPHYLVKHPPILDPENLSEHNCLLFNKGRQRIYWHFRKGRRKKKVIVHGNLSSKSGTPLLEAALQHSGLVQLPTWMVDDLITQGKLVTCLNDWTVNLSDNDSGSIYAVYKQSAFPNPLIRLFLDFILQKLS